MSAVRLYQVRHRNPANQQQALTAGMDLAKTAIAALDGSGIDIRARPMYTRWASKLRVRYDADLFTANDVINLVMRVGLQVGIGEGRPDSKSSAGCGWGTFRVVGSDEAATVATAYGIPT